MSAHPPAATIFGLAAICKRAHAARSNSALVKAHTLNNRRLKRETFFRFFVFLNFLSSYFFLFLINFFFYILPFSLTFVHVFILCFVVVNVTCTATFKIYDLCHKVLQIYETIVARCRYRCCSQLYYYTDMCCCIVTIKLIEYFIVCCCYRHRNESCFCQCSEANLKQNCWRLYIAIGFNETVVANFS